MEHLEPELCTCSALRQASRHLSRIYDEALAPAGLGINQYAVLSRLSRFGPLAQNELADRLVMDRSTLGHLLGPLQQRGLVDVAVDSDDRRRKLLSLGTAGEQCLSTAQPLWAQAQRDFEETFGSEQSDALRLILMNVTNVAMPGVATD